MEDEEFIRYVGKLRFVPLIVLEDPDDAVPLAKALVKGGLPIAEVTFRTDAAAEVIRRMHEEVPECLTGAGTVHNVTTAWEAVNAGAQFIVTPGMNPHVVDYCMDNGIPVLPGTVTPADMEAALDFGLKAVKFFPAEAYGGIKTLKALAGPYASLKFMPTGGVNMNNAADYLKLSNVLAVGGSFMTPSDLVKAKDWEGITAICRKAVALAPEKAAL